MITKVPRFIAMGILAFLFLLAFSSANQTDPRKLVPHIAAGKALQLVQEGKMILLDVHPGKDKNKSDIVGALFVPSYKLDQVKLNVPSEVTVGVFCN